MEDQLFSGVVVQVYPPGSFGYVRHGDTQFVFQFAQVKIAPDAGNAQNASTREATSGLVEGTRVRFTVDNAGRVVNVIRPVRKAESDKT